ncbi:MAG: trigger factor [Verrucomicrobiota bacterium]|nr:trigger factor [Verrucomicrobiota bacterium]
MSALASSEELKNDDLRVVVHRKPACRIELEVHATPVMVQKARKAAIKVINKEVTTPGFRKGKAPEETIERKFSAQIAKELHKQLADLAYVEAQKLAKIPLLNQNSSISFDVKKESEEGIDLLFVFETEPKVPTADPKKFQAKPVQRPEVGDIQVDEAILQMRFFYAQWKVVEDRPIQDGDYIMIDLETIDGEQSQKVFNQVRFEVSKARMATWMKELVSGAKSGDVLEGISRPEENASEEEKKQFEPKKVRLTISKVEEAILPELDDEFAKKVGASDVTGMRDSIRQILEARAEEKVQDDLREQINDFLIEEYMFDLPRSLIETEKKHRMDNMVRDPKFKATWDKASQEERKNIETKVEREADQAVRLFYLSRQIVRDLNLPITHQEVENEAVKTLRSFGAQNTDQIPKEMFALALSKIILFKAQSYILEHQVASNN